ncbi:putative NPL4-like protein 1 [Sesbania bispinosa]|nr:putative NPL4-like protein 1 [Sesbania bispinosa]
MRVSRQENPHCELVSFDRDCANAFQHYVNETLALRLSGVGSCTAPFRRKGRLRWTSYTSHLSRTVSQDKKDYTLSNREVLQAAEYHAESGLKEWVTAVVKLEVNEDMGADVHFEAFQMSDVCIRLFREGWFDTDIGEDDDPKLSKMKKDVVVGVKDTREVDNDFLLGRRQNL